MVINLADISKEIIGKSLPVPLSGTLSGHAAGEPFDKLVYQLIKEQLPDNTYRQYEYLNELYKKNGSHLSYDERATLIRSKSLQFLLNRGKKTTSEWTDSAPFEEKQNDTADIIVTGEDYFQLIDVKTVNQAKDAQPPNIISASKISEMCRLMLENDEFDMHDIFYFEVKWKVENGQMVCVDSTARNLFKTDPSKLYINWAAAMQIQFKVSSLSQDYEGSKKEWCQGFLQKFTSEATRRVRVMEQNYVKKYESLF